jgi:hypothetical protein
MDYTPLVLKNKGVPCLFAKTTRTGTNEQDWGRVTNDDGEPVIETIHVKFTNNSISDIEEMFDGLEKWQEAIEQKPYNTIRQTLATAMKRSIYDIGEAMLDGEIVTYSNVVGTAWSIANGVDPIVASRMLSQTLALAEENKKQLAEGLAKALPDLQIGDNGSESGPKRAGRSKNSGN